jgi:hypothetical protein
VEVPDPQSVTLHIRSFVTMGQGYSLDGIVAGTPVTSLTVEPPPVNTPNPEIISDTLQLVGEDTTAPILIGAGEDITLSFSYNVTTERLRTTVQATLLDEVTGAAPDGWTIAFGDGTNEEMGTSVTLIEAASLIAGSSFPFTATIHTDAGVAPGSTVVLRLTSEVDSLNSPASVPTSVHTEVVLQISAVSARGLDGCEDIALPPTINAETLDFGAIQWNGTGYPTAERPISISIPVYDPVCSDSAGQWIIQVRSNGMTNVDGMAMPPEALAVIGPAGTVPEGVTMATGPVPVTEAGVTIATIDGNAEPGTSWLVNFALSPPSDMPPGFYEAPVVFDVVAADR